MSFTKKEQILCLSILLFGIAGPLMFPGYTFQIAVLWMMVIFSQTWDTLGGQMGYNSLGNIFFFGAGMYICAVTQISLYYDICTYTAHSGAVKVDFSPYQYFSGLAAGLLAAAVISIVFAVIFGWAMFGLRGPYFAIGTLGVALAAGELIGAWDCIGGGGGISLPPYPGEPYPGGSHPEGSYPDSGPYPDSGSYPEPDSSGSVRRSLSAAERRSLAVYLAIKNVSRPPSRPYNSINPEHYINYTDSHLGFKSLGENLCRKARHCTSDALGSDWVSSCVSGGKNVAGDGKRSCSMKCADGYRLDQNCAHMDMQYCE